MEFVSHFLRSLDQFIRSRYKGKDAVKQEDIPPTTEAEIEQLRKIIGEGTEDA